MISGHCAGYAAVLGMPFQFGVQFDRNQPDTLLTLAWETT